MSQKNPKEESRRSALIALFCLSDKPLSGYGVRQRIKEWHMEEYLATSPATIYRSLERLKHQGLLSSKRVQRGKYPPSVVYSITDKGRHHYENLIRETADFKRTAYSISPVLGLGARLPRKERMAMAKDWQAAAKSLAAKLDDRLNDHSPGGTYGKPYAEWLMLAHERALLRAEVDWLNEYMDMLKSGAA